MSRVARLFSESENCTEKESVNPWVSSQYPGFVRLLHISGATGHLFGQEEEDVEDTCIQCISGANRGL